MWGGSGVDLAFGLHILLLELAVAGGLVLVGLLPLLFEVHRTPRRLHLYTLRHVRPHVYTLRHVRPHVYTLRHVRTSANLPPLPMLPPPSLPPPLPLLL